MTQTGKRAAVVVGRSGVVAYFGKAFDIGAGRPGGGTAGIYVCA